ncbi:MAG: sigma 54-interacting transcriptional regulator, partial [Spirochaetota bacterium]
MSNYSEADGLAYSDLVYEIGEIFISHDDLNGSLNRVIDLVCRSCGFTRILVHMYMRDEEESIVDISRGYSLEEIERGRYKPGEGIIGRVLKTGRPEIIPLIRKSSDFLNKTGSRTSQSDLDSSFICVPVTVSGTHIGTISADLPAGYSEQELANKALLLSFTAVMSAQSLNSRMEMLRHERSLIEENTKLKLKLDKAGRSSVRLIGQSTLMQELIEKILQVSRTDTTVLITGESGTGKELVAEAIQRNSRRADKPFIKVNIAALPESLIESELFGHEKGAFTGAITQKKGRFELASGGTIFLDEIGDLPFPLQV